MVDGTRLIAPDGGAVVLLQPSGRWPWVVALLGAVLVLVGGILVSHDTDPARAGTSQVAQ